MRKMILSLFLSEIFLSGCTMIPQYRQPEFMAAKSWNSMTDYKMPEKEQSASHLTWQEFFSNPELQKIITIALENNRDLRLAVLNIDEARALYRIERSALLPSINANGSANYRKIPDQASPNNQGESSELYAANLGINNYELDLFGRIRSQSEAIKNEYKALQEEKTVIQNALIAETMNVFLQLLADRKLLDLTRKTLEAQQHTHDILTQSLENGIGTAQDVALAETAVETARVNFHQYRRFVEQDTNTLMVLMGVAYDETLIPEITLDDIDLPENIAAGLPSEVLLNRPDIRQAEYNLLARNADIGAARASFFPNITLTGASGFASEGLSNLLTGGAWGAWSFIPEITLPVFQGGRNKAGLDVAEIRKEKAIVNYEQAIEIAFREVSDELAARATLTEQLKAQEHLVIAAQKVYDISSARYKSGIDSFLEVLDAQRNLYIFQQNEIRTERQRLSNLVTLYKVLGGGSAK